MNPISLLVSIVVVVFSIKSNVAENCVFQHPFQSFQKPSKCHPYDYCLAFDEHRWQTVQFATKTAYRLHEKSLEKNHFEMKSK